MKKASRGPPGPQAAGPAGENPAEMDVRLSNAGASLRRVVSGAPPPTSEERELKEAVAEMEAALEALRRAQSLWVGARPWSGGKTWDLATAQRAIDEAEARVHAARARVAAALALARRREVQNGSQG